MLNKILLMSVLTISSYNASADDKYWKDLFSDLRNSNYQKETVVGSDEKTKATFLRNLKKDGDVRFAGFDSLLLAEGPSLKVADSLDGFKMKCSYGSSMGDKVNIKMTVKLNQLSGLKFQLKDGKTYSLDQVKNPVIFGDLVSNARTDINQYKMRLDSLMNSAIKEARVQDGKKVIEVDLSEDLDLACRISSNKILVNVEQKVSYEKTLEIKKNYTIESSSEFAGLYNSFWDDKASLKKEGMYVNSVVAAWNLAEKGYKKESILEGDRFQSIVEALSTPERIGPENSGDVDRDIEKRWQLTVEYKVPTTEEERLVARRVPVVGSKVSTETTRNF